MKLINHPDGFTDQVVNTIAEALPPELGVVSVTARDEVGMQRRLTVELLDSRVIGGEAR